MKAKEILEMAPQMITHVDNGDIKLATDECINALNANKCELVKSFSENVALYRFKKNVNNGFYFVSKNNSILYFANYKKIEISEKALPLKTGVRQVLIHRASSSIFAAGISATIFWEHLFTEFNCLISDAQQSPDGKRFWIFRIKEAFDKNLTVRVINTNDDTFVDVKTPDELDALDQSIWGESKWFQRVVIAIYKADNDT